MQKVGAHVLTVTAFTTIGPLLPDRKAVQARFSDSELH